MVTFQCISYHELCYIYIYILLDVIHTHHHISYLIDTHITPILVIHTYMTLPSSLSLSLSLVLVSVCGKVAVYELQVRWQNALPRSKAFNQHRGLAYLERYFFLIVINAYLRDQLSHLNNPSSMVISEGSENVKENIQMTFVDWLAARPEITALLRDYDFPEL